jgi:hypothetical protein
MPKVRVAFCAACVALRAVKGWIASHATPKKRFTEVEFETLRMMRGHAPSSLLPGLPGGP